MTVNSKEENLRFCPNYVQEFGLSTASERLLCCTVLYARTYIHSTYKHNHEWNCSAVSSIVTNKILFLLSFTFRVSKKRKKELSFCLLLENQGLFFLLHKRQEFLLKVLTVVSVSFPLLIVSLSPPLTKEAYRLCNSVGLRICWESNRTIHWVQWSQPFSITQKVTSSRTHHDLWVKVLQGW